MKIFYDVRVAHYLAIGLLVAAATFGFATSAQARVLLGSPGPAALTKGLVGYWPLDGAVTNWTSNTTRDLSGNGNTGSLVSLGTTTAPVAGKIGQALNLSNVGTVSVPNNDSINLGSTETIAFWIKGSALDQYSQILKKDSAGTAGWMIQNAESGIISDLYMRMDTSGGTNQPCAGYPAITNVLNGAWHHVVFVINNGSCTSYKDGIRGAKWYLHGRYGVR